MVTHRWWGNKLCKRTCKKRSRNQLWSCSRSPWQARLLGHVRCTLRAPLVTSRNGSSTARLQRLEQAASWSGR